MQIFKNTPFDFDVKKQKMCYFSHHNPKYIRAECKKKTKLLFHQKSIHLSSGLPAFSNGGNDQTGAMGGITGCTKPIESITRSASNTRSVSGRSSIFHCPSTCFQSTSTTSTPVTLPCSPMKRRVERLHMRSQPSSCEEEVFSTLGQ